MAKTPPTELSGRRRPLLGRIAVQYNLIAEDDLQRGLRLQAGARQGVALGEILITEGWLTPEQLRFALKLQESAIEFLGTDTLLRLRQVLLGKVLVRQSGLSLARLREVLREPDAMDDLARRLTRAGLVQASELDEARHVLDANLLVCASCYAPYLLKEGAAAAARARCEWCNGKLVSPPTDESEGLTEAHTVQVGAPKSRLAPKLVPGAFFAGYEILDLVAEGGMGIVYRARQPGKAQVIALKVLRAGATASETDKRRFLREAEAASTLRHEFIAPVYEVGESEGVYFFTMEYIEGRPLHQEREAGPLTIREAMVLMADVADAVHYAHTRGIIHRDLKPANIMINRAGEPRVVDFGLAKLAGAPGQDTEHHTVTGAIVGTPQYMSPEQAGGANRDLDIRSDVYSLGVILYELLTGEPPHRAESLMELVKAIHEQEPVPPSRLKATLDSDLDAIVLKCLEKERDRRYQSARELSDDIDRYLKGWPVLARRATFGYRLLKLFRRKRAESLATAAAILIAAGVGAAIWSGQRREDDQRRAEVRGLLAEGQRRIEARDYAAAVETASRARVLAPQDERAFELLQEARRLEEEVRRVARARQLIEEGRAELDRRHFESAIGKFQAALEIAALPEATDGILAAREARGKEELGKRIAEADLAMQEADRLVALGETAATPEESRDLLVQALLQYDGALKAYPEHPEARRRKAQAALRLSDIALAAEDFGLALYMAKQAELLDPGPKMRRAIAHIEEVRNTTRNYRERVLAGDAALEREDWEDALRQYAEAAAVQNTDELQRKILRARLLRALDQSAESVRAAAWDSAEGYLMEADRLAAALQNPSLARRVENARTELKRLAGRNYLESAKARIREALAEADPVKQRPLLQDALNDLQDTLDNADDEEARELARDVRRRLATPAGMVFHPGGSIPVGSNEDGETNPPRRVMLAPFYLDREEVSNAAFQRFIEADGYRKAEFWDEQVRGQLGGFLGKDGSPGPAGWTRGRYPSGEGRLPVTGVTWYEARAYARWIGKRLPSAEEWEAGAGWDPAGRVMRAYPWGDVFRKLGGNFSGEGASASATHPDDRSPLGNVDMAGNVSEWTVGPPQGDDAGPAAVIKGGNWLMVPFQHWGRASFARLQAPSYRGEFVGFRLAKDVAE